MEFSQTTPRNEQKKAKSSNFDENASPNHDLKRTQMTSKDLNRLRTKMINPLETKTKMFPKVDPCMIILKLTNTI